MARDHGRILCRIWEDDDFRGLSAEAQRLYVLLLSQPTLNHAGVIGMTMRRWARCCRSTSVEQIEKAVAELSDARFVVVDEDTEELLIRSFIRNDGVATQPNILKTALREAEQTASPRLRTALATELRKLPPKPADTEKMKYPNPHAMASLLDPEPFPTNAENPSANPSENPSTEAPGTHAERSRGRGRGGGISRSVGTPVSEPAPKRATRIPDNWTLNDELRAWGKQHTPLVDLDRECEKFVDYWRARAGKDATKLDWLGTWRNWLRRRQEELETRPSRLRPVQTALETDPAVTGQRRYQE